MNLINDPWIPIQRKSGAKALIAPWQLTEADDPVIALNAPRPDFNGALLQFLIGLLQTAATPASHDQWLDWLEEPPTPEVLKACFEPYADAFALQGEKGSFMQDFEPLENGAVNSIAEMLIDTSGGGTHFVKAGSMNYVCSCCAATALFTLQTNAPAGGRGHLTSIRGGGPMTTLVILDAASDLANDLWHSIWLNVIDLPLFKTLSGDTSKNETGDIFPWLALTRFGDQLTTTPVDAHPLQMYWGMPRRLKILWDRLSSGHCDLCGSFSDSLVSHYRTRPYGVNYDSAWQHPLSPYSISAQDGALIALHPQPGVMTYQHWVGITDGDDSVFIALVAKRYRVLAERWGEQFRLYAFGYDMDKMKARCWYEATFPLFFIADEIKLDFVKRVQSLTSATEEFSRIVTNCVKDAWFDGDQSKNKEKKSNYFKSSPAVSIKIGFYQHTEIAFYQAAKALQTKLVDGTDQTVLHSWHATLRKAAFDLFDYWAARGDIAQANPRRVADARSKLIALCYSKKIKEALQLPINEKKASKTSKSKKEAA
ncbi:type I-E CRISPR-associated protein Cse1/CasA [Thiothrix eikelboomii]|uniref:type I-E CRISPR-associated protein Cse1/CasA n=1 Tax=Thiothrix eikelboomii TaxID=92487 RepID=UPI003BAE74CB